MLQVLDVGWLSWLVGLFALAPRSRAKIEGGSALAPLADQPENEIMAAICAVGPAITGTVGSHEPEDRLLSARLRSVAHLNRRMAAKPAETKPASARGSRTPAKCSRPGMLSPVRARGMSNASARRLANAARSIRNHVPKARVALA